MHSYREAFSAVLADEEGNETKVVEVLDDSSLEEGTIQIALYTVWTDPAVRVVFDLTVPIVTPVRYDKDEGLFGHMVRLPSSRTQHWCHPLLICPFAEDLAGDTKSGAARFRYSKTEDWKFEWINWYGRVNRMVNQVLDALYNSTQHCTTGLVRMYFRRGLMNIITPTNEGARAGGSWQENGSNTGSGLPVTDVRDILYRHMFEVRLGFPDCPSNDELYESIKYKYIEVVDGMCDICWTGKNHTAREVSRVFDGDAISFSTGKPMPKLGRAFNPLMQHAEVKRVWRENRSCSGWLTIDSPIVPPLTAKGIKLPGEYPNKITTLVTAIIDIPGMNVYEATEQDVIDFPDRVELGEEISLDGILITPSGQKKMKAIVTTPEIKTAEDFFAKKEEWEELPGFQFEEDPVQVEVLVDGTSVYNYQYRCSWSKPCRCRYDKVKCLCGGIKGVTMPIDQLYTMIGGEIVPVDIVVSERTALSKGARDLFLYPLMAHAGFTEVDPTLTMEELVQQTEEGLLKKGLPRDGRFPIYADKVVPTHRNREIDEEQAETLSNLSVSVNRKAVRKQIGHAIVGPAPWCRPCEREDRQASASKGLRLNSHARVLGGLDIPIDEEGTGTRIKKTADFFYNYRDIEVATTVEPELEVF